MTDRETELELRLTMDPDEGAEVWCASIVDVEANIAWFEACAPTPLGAATRVAEHAARAHSRRGWKFTDLAVAVEDLVRDARHVLKHNPDGHGALLMAIEAVEARLAEPADEDEEES